MSRSENMKRIRSKNTDSELFVRRLLCSLQFTGYRIHRKDIPGKPDIAFIGKKKAIFVNGCFWHGHNCKEGVRRPKSNVQYWIPKSEKNRDRDALNVKKLQKIGWDVLLIWDCELFNQELLKERILSLIHI